MRAGPLEASSIAIKELDAKSRKSADRDLYKKAVERWECILSYLALPSETAEKNVSVLTRDLFQYVDFTKQCEKPRFVCVKMHLIKPATTSRSRRLAFNSYCSAGTSKSGRISLIISNISKRQRPTTFFRSSNSSFASACASQRAMASGGASRADRKQQKRRQNFSDRARKRRRFSSGDGGRQSSHFNAADYER